MKISAPGVLGNWLRGTGANAVDGALTSFYTDIQTGVSDGVLSLALGVLADQASTRWRPTSHRVDGHGLLRRRRDQPGQLGRAARRSSERHDRGRQILHRLPWPGPSDRHEFALNKMVEVGAEQKPPVTMFRSRRKSGRMGERLPDLAGDWAAPTRRRAFRARPSSAYMDGLRARAKPRCATGTPASRTVATGDAGTENTTDAPRDGGVGPHARAWAGTGSSMARRGIGHRS
jgi:hypothetical protein